MQANLDPKIRRRNRFIMTSLCGVAFSMGVLAFASPPLYRMFCQVTGYGGTTQVADAVSDKVLDRKVRVRFVANTDAGLDILVDEIVVPRPPVLRDDAARGFSRHFSHSLRPASPCGESNEGAGREERIGTYGRAARARRRPPQGDPPGRRPMPAGGVERLARCAASRCAALLPCRHVEPAQGARGVGYAGSPSSPPSS